MATRSPSPADVTQQTPGRRERAKAAKRAAILASAQQRLRAEGYDAMTMAAVARDADVAIGTVFQYAATKAELLMMVTAERWGGMLPALLERLPDDDPVVAVRALLRPVVDTTVVEPSTSMAIAREVLFGTDGPHQREVLAIVARLEEAIADILRRHGAGERAATAARLIVSGGVMEVNRGRTGRDSAARLEERLGEIIEIALAGAREG